MPAFLVFLLVMITSVGVCALPCCQNMSMVEVGKQLQCQTSNDSFFSDLKNRCENGLSIITSKDIDYNSTEENDKQTKLKLEDHHWTEDYCTGIMRSDTYGMPGEDIKEVEIKLICHIPEEEEFNFALYGTCSVISSAFLLLTLVIYFWLPELRDVQGKCVMCLVFCLMLAYLHLSYVQIPATSPTLTSSKCLVTAFLMYYWFLGAFFWLNLSSFNMFLSIVLPHINIAEKKLMFIYYVVGWGAPLCFVSFALITHHLSVPDFIKPKFNISSCWFDGKWELWLFFYGPVTCLLILNIIYFISMSVALWVAIDHNVMPRLRTLRTKFFAYLRLFLATGMLWLFEVISAIQNEPWFVTDLINSLQGVIIFMLMVMMRKRVWRAIGSREICGTKLCNCWQRMDVDGETLNDVNSIEPHT